MPFQRSLRAAVLLPTICISLSFLAGCPALTPSSGPTETGGASIGVGSPIAPTGATHEDSTDNSGSDSPTAAPADPSAVADQPPAPAGATPMYRALGGPDQAGNQTPPIAGGVMAPSAIPGDTELTVLGTINACVVERQPSLVSVTLSGSVLPPAETIDPDTGKTTAWKKIPFVRFVITPAKGPSQCADIALPDPDPVTGRQAIAGTYFVPTLQGWDFYLSPTGLALITPLPAADPLTGLSACPENATLNLERATRYGVTQKSAPVLDQSKPACPPLAEEMQLPVETIDRLQQMHRLYFQQTR